MLTRIWEAEFDPRGRDRLMTYTREVSLEVLGTRPGCLGVVCFVKGETLYAQTFWDTQASIDVLA